MSGKKRKKEKEPTEEEKYLKFYTDLRNLPLEYNEVKLGFREFTNTFRFPQMFTICKGEYEGYGYPTRSNPGLMGWLFAWCRRLQYVVKAQCIHFSPSKKMLTKGDVFEIKDDYKGQFEIISENGKGVEHIRSVSELSKHYNKFFVTMKSVTALKRNPENGWESCTLDIGTTIRVESVLTDVTELPPRGRDRLLRFWTRKGILFLSLNNNTVRFVQFRFETDRIMLPHTVRTIAAHFSFPINVRLLEGSPPPEAVRNFRSTILRVYEYRTEDVLTAWPLARDGPKALANIPVQSEMKVRLLKNLKTVMEYAEYKEIIERIKLLKPPPPQNKIIPPPMTTSVTALPQSSTSVSLNFPSTDIHQPSTSGLQRTALDIHRPSTSGLQRTDIDIHQPSTSGLQRTASDFAHTGFNSSKINPAKASADQQEDQDLSDPQIDQIRSLKIASTKDNADKKTSGTLTAQPYTIHRSLRNKRKEDQHQTFGLNTVPEGRIPQSEPMEVDYKQFEGLAPPNRLCRSLYLKSPLKNADDQTLQQAIANLSPQSNPDVPSITDPDEIMYIQETSSKDPYDEIDEIYANNRKTFLERWHLPLEKETFL